MKHNNLGESFRFCPELFEYRSRTMEFLSDEDYSFLIDYQGIDVCHDIYGIEITGISTKELAEEIAGSVEELFCNKKWIDNPWSRVVDYDDGWTAEIFRDFDDQSDDWWKDSEVEPGVPW